MRALLVARESIAAALQTFLQREGYSTEVAIDGEDGLDIARRYSFDIVVCELTVPGFGRCELTRRIRSAKVPVPIVIVSEESAPAYVAEALHAGADDYVRAPYDPNELLARLCAVVRRTHGHPSATIMVGDLAINVSERSVKVDGTLVRLTNKEWDVLEALALNVNRCVSREYILERSHVHEEETEIKVIDAFVYKLRRKLAHASGGTQYIKTEWGKGYILGAPKAIHPSRETNI
ncbi:response regulator transcription factor [Candidatus Nomurabacteria bacterium]|nr:response regulator transcription factor [Candidatus Nomurabacteria bacterium]